MQKLIKFIAATFLTLSISSCQTKAPSEPTSPATNPPSAPLIDPSKHKDYKESQRTSLEMQLSIPYRSLDTSKSIETFGFGACNDQDQEQPLWKLISKNSPQLFIMMGDNVYASAPESKPIYAQYLKLNKNQDYRELREKVPFLATWDDHDFGQNDGGFNNPEKDEARRVFLNYWGYLKQTLPKKQMAIYHSRMIGKAPHRVHVILLDTRWDRSDLVKNPEHNPDDQDVPPKIYKPTTDKSTKILSSEQWAWLEDELQKPAELKILVSSIQVLPETPGFEKWANFPHEREKLLNLIKKNKSKNVVIFSGDRHLAAVSKVNLGSNHELFEITGSALNRPSRLKTTESDPSYTADTYGAINFGLGKIDWKKRALKLEIRDVDDKVQISQDIRF